MGVGTPGGGGGVSPFLLCKNRHIMGIENGSKNSFVGLVYPPILLYQSNVKYQSTDDGAINIMIQILIEI